MFYVHKYLPTLISLINVELGINVEGCKSCQITKHALLLFEGICGHWNGNYTLRGKVVPEGWAVTAQPSGTTLVWTINFVLVYLSIPFFVLVDPHPFYCTESVWIDQNKKKRCGSKKTSLMVLTVSFKENLQCNISVL